LSLGLEAFGIGVGPDWRTSDVETRQQNPRVFEALDVLDRFKERLRAGGALSSGGDLSEAQDPIVELNKMMTQELDAPRLDRIWHDEKIHSWEPVRGMQKVGTYLDRVTGGYEGQIDAMKTFMENSLFLGPLMAPAVTSIKRVFQGSSNEEEKKP